MKSPRITKMIVLAVLLAGSAFQLGACATNTVAQIARVAVIDVFFGPLLGDTCTIFNRTNCG